MKRLIANKKTVERARSCKVIKVKGEKDSKENNWINRGWQRSCLLGVKNRRNLL